MNNHIEITKLNQGNISATLRFGILPDGKPLDEIMAYAPTTELKQFHQLAMLLGYELVDVVADSNRESRAACVWQRLSMQINPCDNLTPSDLWEGAYIPVTVTEVVLNRAEGPSRLCGIDHKFPTLAEADSVLMAWAWGMPADQIGYDKVDFTVYLSNGDTYEGRFDLQVSHRKSASIKGHMVSHLEWVAKNGDMIGAKYAEQAKVALPVYRSL